ncbi:MAG: hypothetical protein OEV61_02920 [Chloroflexota bacterium]|jgi:hypothetical protein|nr:hypothetical protein [Chloroflexota bacterium]MDH5242922.1 hypothetical protein [Chloroflexota bacterium]
MVRRFARRFGVAVSVTAVVLSLTVGTALAGEVTGNGKHKDMSHANSICAFSGLNDYPDGSQSGPAGKVQSYGQDVRLYGVDPRQFNPGDACRGGSNPYRQ